RPARRGATGDATDARRRRAAGRARTARRHPGGPGVEPRRTARPAARARRAGRCGGPGSAVRRRRDPRDPHPPPRCPASPRWAGEFSRWARGSRRCRAGGRRAARGGGRDRRAPAHGAGARLPGPARDDCRLPGAAGGGPPAGRLRAAPAAGRGRRGLQPAAVLADGAGEPRPDRDHLRRPRTPGLRIPAPRGGTRPAGLGRDRLDPVQPPAAPARRWRTAVNGPTGWTTLVPAETLAPALDDPMLVVLDARFSLADASAGEDAWRQAHIPGARYVHLDRDLSGAHAVGAGRHPWPGAADFGRMLAARGITPAHQ